VRRGEVWVISTLRGRERRVLVVGADAAYENLPNVPVVPVEDVGYVRETLVTVRIDSPVEGIAIAPGIAPVSKAAAVKRLGTVPTHTMDQVDMALRAVLEL